VFGDRELSRAYLQGSKVVQTLFLEAETPPCLLLQDIGLYQFQDRGLSVSVFSLHSRQTALKLL